MEYAVKLPNNAGVTTNLKLAIDLYLDRHHCKWRNSVMCLPTATIPDWTGGGETTLKLLLSKFEGEERFAEYVKSKQGLVRGAEAERIVLHRFMNLLSEGAYGCAIFHGLKITSKHMDLVNQLTDKKIAFTPKEIEIDLLAIHPEYGMIVFEVKSDTRENSVKSGGGRSQLKAIRECVTQIVAGVTPENIVQLTSILAFPFMNKRKESDCGTSGTSQQIYLQKEHVETHETFKEFWVKTVENTLNGISQHIYENLVRVFVLIRLPVFSNQQVITLDYRLSLSMQKYELKLLNMITSSQFLEPVIKQQEKYKDGKQKTKKKDGTLTPQQSDIEKLCKFYKCLSGALVGLRYVLSSQNLSTAKWVDVINSWDRRITGRMRRIEAEIQRGVVAKAGASNSGIFNQLMFLTPEQAAIWDHPSPALVIDGYACTGKTVLILNKVLQILQSKNDNVIVVIPTFLFAYYKAYFKFNLPSFEQVVGEQRLVICNVNQFVESELNLETNYHIFLDEFCSSLQEEAPAVSRRFQTRIYNRLQEPNLCTLWLAQDAGQTIGASENVAILGEISDMIMRFGPGEPSLLTLALRCTDQVYNYWTDIYKSNLLKQGHSIPGPPPEIRKETTMEQMSPNKCMVFYAWKYLDRYLTDGYKPSDIGIAFYDPEPVHGTEYWRDMMISHKEEFSNNPLVNTELFCGLNHVTVQQLDYLLSYEFPLLIFVDHPKLPEPIDIAKYMAFSRCIVKLIYVSIAADYKVIFNDRFACLLYASNITNKAQLAFRECVHFVCMEQGRSDYKTKFLELLRFTGSAIANCCESCLLLSKNAKESFSESDIVSSQLDAQVWRMLEPFIFWKHGLVESGVFTEESFLEASKLQHLAQLLTTETQAQFSQVWTKLLANS